MHFLPVFPGRVTGFARNPGNRFFLLFPDPGREMTGQAKAFRLDAPDLQLVGNLASFLAARHFLEGGEMVGFFPDFSFHLVAFSTGVGTHNFLVVR